MPQEFSSTGQDRLVDEWWKAFNDEPLNKLIDYALGNSFERYTEGAIRGYARYQDPYSEEMHTLPYTSGRGYYSEGHETYYLDGSGDYYVVQPDGYHQFLNPYDDY